MPETAVDPERLSNASISDIADDNKTMLGKYEMGKLLGCGAFANVYHARNISKGQSVAIKVISKSRISNTSLMSNIKREVSIIGKLHNIIKLHEVSPSKTKIYLVMEFAKGGELFTKVSRGRFTENLVASAFGAG